jgi:hypothetical protein
MQLLALAAAGGPTTFRIELPLAWAGRGGPDVPVDGSATNLR